MFYYKLVRAVAVLCLLLLNLTGCGSGCRKLFLENEGIRESPQASQLIETSHMAADALIQGAGLELDHKKPVIAATFVNIDDLEYAASFGRAISRHVASRFTQQGIEVVEMLFRNDILIKQNSGEFMLSRMVRDISNEHDAQAVVVGTYAVARNTVYITAKIIRSGDSVVLASYDYSLPKDSDVKFMLDHGCDSGCSSGRTFDDSTMQ